MRQSEQITFGGGGLDRAAHLRADPGAQARLWARADAAILPIWRGKPLVAPDGLGWLPAAHPLVADRPHLLTGGFMRPSARRGRPALF